MSATNRRGSGPSSIGAETILIWVSILALIVIVGGLWVSIKLGTALSDVDQAVPGNPMSVILSLAKGELAWPVASWFVLGCYVMVLVGGVVAVVMWRSRHRRRTTRIDVASAHMGKGSDLDHLSKKGQTKTAERLGVNAAVGLPLVDTLTGRRLFAGWEDVMVDVWGPRTGKTTSRAIPAILDAPGAVLVTSNKRDVVDATRDPRSLKVGGQVWVFDPQNLTGEPPNWWWNPLTYVTDEVKAQNLASVFASGSREPGAKTDAYFDPAGEDLLAALLLAAALSGRPLTDVYLWLTQPTNDEPASILDDSHYRLLAASVRDAVNAPDKQRSGIYGTAKQMVACLTNSKAAAWVTPQAVFDRRRQFDPTQFVRTPSTLYSLSKEGRGSAGPLVTALTVAVTEAAEDFAKTQAGGRLSVPMVCVLDEAANVCRWKELPNLYSHYGSRGIIMMTILQSWSQGVEVWGREGMRKLWSAATIKVYGGGVSEVEFLDELSRLIGEVELESTSVSNSAGKGGRSVSVSTRKERVLDVSDLGSLPKGRAVVISSGTPPLLGKTLPWMTGPHAIAVEASINAHDPKASDTLTDAASSMVALAGSDNS